MSETESTAGAACPVAKYSGERSHGPGRARQIGIGAHWPTATAQDRSLRALTVVGRATRTGRYVDWL